MAESLPQSEIDQVREAGLFHLEEMTDTQITELYDALWRQSDYAAENGNRLGFERSTAADVLIGHVEADLRHMGTRDPERLRNLLGEYMEFDGPWGRAVAGSVEVLFDYDYEFTRDALVSLYAGADDFAHSAADRVLSSILTSEQVSVERKLDYEAALKAIDHWDYEDEV